MDDRESVFLSNLTPAPPTPPQPPQQAPSPQGLLIASTDDDESKIFWANLTTPQEVGHPLFTTEPLWAQIFWTPL